MPAPYPDCEESLNYEYGISVNLLLGSFDSANRVRVGSFLPALVLCPLLVLLVKALT